MASLYSLQGLISTVQILALIVSTIGKTFRAFEIRNDTVYPFSASGR